MAFQQWGAKFFLKIADAPAQRRLSQSQVSRRGVDAALLRDGEEVPQVVEFQTHPVPMWVKPMPDRHTKRNSAIYLADTQLRKLRLP